MVQELNKIQHEVQHRKAWTEPSGKEKHNKQITFKMYQTDTCWKFLHHSSVSSYSGAYFVLKNVLSMQGCRLVYSVLIEGNSTNYLLIQYSDFSHALFIQNKIGAFKILIDVS